MGSVSAIPTWIPLPVATTFPFGIDGKGAGADCSDSRPSGSSEAAGRGGNGVVSDEVDDDRTRPAAYESMLERILAPSGGDMMISETGRGLDCIAVIKDDGDG